MDMQTPYREIEHVERLTLDDEERQAIAKASHWMTMAGIIGMSAAALQAFELIGTSFAWIALTYVLGGGAFALVVLIAGLQVSSIRRAAAGEDYQAVERSLRWLAIVFRVKGVLMLAVVCLFVLALLSPMLYAFL